MTEKMEKTVGRIYEELAKWCAERNVVYEYNFSTDEGESCTFITPDTTLTVNHVENRDPEQFSKYVKSVLFGVDDIIIDHLNVQLDIMNTKILELKAQVDDLNKEIVVKDDYIGRLEKEDIEKAKDIVYLEEELKKLRDENAGMKYQLDIMNTKILELNDTVREKEKNLNTAADKIIQLTCANTTLKSQIDGLRLQLKAERKGYDELNELYEERCKAFINMCNNYDLEVAKRKKAESERHDDVVDVTRYLVVLGKKKRAEEMIRSLKSQIELITIARDKAVKNLSDDNVSLNSQLEMKRVKISELEEMTRRLKKQLNDTIVSKTKAIDEDITVIENLKRENATLQYKVDALENDIVDLASSYKKELEKKDKESLDLDNNVKDMWATLRSLKKENVELKDANKFLSVKLKKHDEIIEALKVDNDKAEAKIENLLEENFNHVSHVKNLVAQVEILEREKSEITNELNNVVDNYDKSAISLKKELLKKDDEIRSLKQGIVELNDKKNNIIDKLNDESRRLVLEKKKSSAFEQEIDRLLGLCKDKPCVVDVNSMHPSIGIDLSLGEVMKDVKERITKLENGTIYTNDMLTGICNRLDKLEKPSEIDINLREFKKDVKEKQEIIDALNSLDQRIAWMEDHMRSNENDVARSIEKIGEELRRVDNELIHAFTRINKLEDAQPKKTTKKSQKSTLS